MDLDKYAVSVPMILDTRTEHSVIYFSKTWEDLANMLEAPVEFLRSQQFLWSQTAAESISWQLLSPLTATIEYGLGNPANVLATLALLVGPVLNYHPEELAFNKEKFFQAELLDRMKLELAGSFLVEFSTYTNAVRILYYPPLEPEQPRQPGDSRYKGDIEQPALITFQAGDLSYSHLHYDLTETSARMRADYIVNNLEWPENMPKRINDLVVQDKVRFKTYRLEVARSDRSSTARRDAPSAQETLPRSTRFTPAKAFSSVTQDPGVNPFFLAASKYPSMIAHDLSEVIEEAVCVKAECPKPTGDVVNIGTIAVESYKRVLFEPKSVVYRYTGQSSV